MGFGIMNATEIITNFRDLADLVEGDLTSAQELSLLNRCYTELQLFKLWNWLKETANLTFVNYETTLPADFRSFTRDHSLYYLNTAFPVLPRDRMRDSDYCIYKNGNKLIQKGVNEPVLELDYIKVAPALTALTSPIFPTSFHVMLAHLMVARLDIQEQVEKGRTYAPENLSIYRDYLNRLSLEDALT